MRIAKAATKAIEFACKHYHYSKSVPAVQYAYNIYNDKDEWCGTILYGGGANNNLPKFFNKNAGEVLELVRVALNGKQEQTSKAVALSLKVLHKENPLVQIIVSYADHRQKHLGIIYQATNWLYIGTSITSDTQYFFKGKWTHERSINAQKNRDELKRTLPKRENSNKFKYVYCFGKKEREQYTKLAQPYPKASDLTITNEQVKCGNRSAVGQSSILTIEGGAIPTLPLQ